MKSKGPEIGITDFWSVFLLHFVYVNLVSDLFLVPIPDGEKSRDKILLINTADISDMCAFINNPT